MRVCLLSTILNGEAMTDALTVPFEMVQWGLISHFNGIELWVHECDIIASCIPAWNVSVSSESHEL
jgi:hypothetical protein